VSKVVHYTCNGCGTTTTGPYGDLPAGWGLFRALVVVDPANAADSPWEDLPELEFELCPGCSARCLPTLAERIDQGLRQG
jgi:hypothetical protein